jgi:hypothetical protein
MPYKVVNKSGKKVFDETFATKLEAEQAIVDAIRGTKTNSSAMKYYREYKVVPTK